MKNPNKIKTTTRDRIFRIITFTIITFSLFMMFFPIYWMVTTSFKDNNAAIATPPDLSITLKDQYDFVIDSSEFPEYDYQTFKKESVVTIWMLMNKQINKNIGNISVNWVVNNRLKAQTTLSELQYKSLKNDIFSGQVEVFMFDTNRYDSCCKEMEELGCFKVDLNERYKIKQTSGSHETEFATYLNSLQKTDRYGKNGEYFYSFDNAISAVSVSTYWKGAFDNFVRAVKEFIPDGATILNFFFNSFAISSLAVLFQWLLSAGAAYAVAKVVSKKLANFITMFFVLTMMIPSIVYIVPLYGMVARFNLTNNVFAVVLPGVSNAMMFVLFRSFFAGIPNDMYEAAKIDGANEGLIFARIYIPLSRSVFFVIALLTFTANWNDLMWPSMVMKTPTSYTLPVAINVLINRQSSGQTDYALSLAMSTIAMLPTLLIFLIFNKQMAEGLVFDGIKG